MKTIDIPIYGGQLTVTRSLTEFNKAFDRMLEHYGQVRTDESMGRAPSGLTVSTLVDNEVQIISGAFDRKADTRCHEAVHCAQAVAEAIGMDPVKESEAFAHLTQWFFQELAP